MSEKAILIIALIFILSVVSVLLLTAILLHLRKMYVLKNSNRIKAIFQFNDEQINKFKWDIEQKYFIKVSLKSKKAFDGFNKKQYLEKSIYLDSFTQKYNLIQENKRYL